ncbi:hypothetical protein F1737_08900 [Methanoplanus sp. FWC-SCC4]|uniref:Uncharacterized protein n=1 Tax=Methanochimaera problematica TaxID=2609417 RepID=A0AA97FDD2_9EURY|nr:hypothetical protein [Methanoplanus sp. FWC-SCC4]WOF16797.1 hypothetical protein F1737_08900 [Methanoplanus sp. FWC-SCC4]
MRIKLIFCFLVMLFLVSGANAESGYVTLGSLKDLFEDGALDVDDYQRMKLSLNETEESYYSGQNLHTASVRTTLSTDDNTANVNYGETIEIWGTSDGGSTTNNMLWIFSPTGKIKPGYVGDSGSPVILKIQNDGSFRYKFYINDNLESGIYRYLIQHPYYSADYDVWYYNNQIKTSEGDSYSISGSITGEKLCDIIVNYINKPSIDDTYSKGMFMINPVPTETPTPVLTQQSTTEATEEIIPESTPEEMLQNVTPEVTKSMTEPTASLKPTTEVTTTNYPISTANQTEMPSYIEKAEGENKDIINQVVVFFRTIFGM